MYEFEEIKDDIHDASGIEEPTAYLWKRLYGCYYPDTTRMKNISNQDYVIWNRKYDHVIDSLDTVYHYTTIIEMVNNGFKLMPNEEIVPVASLPISWRYKINEAIEKTKRSI